MSTKKVRKIKVIKSKKKYNTKGLYSLFGFGVLLTGLFALLFVNSSSSFSNSGFSYAQTCSQGAPSSATDYFRLFNIHNDQWSGADGGRSVKLPDGRLMWLWSDTLIGPLNTDGSRGNFYLTNNSAFVQDKGCISVLNGPMSGGKRTSWIVPPSKYGSDRFYWLGDSFIEAGKLKIFLHRYQTTQVFPAFQGVDIGTLDTSGTPRLVSIDDTPSSNIGGDKAVQWGNAILPQSDFVYIYGTSAPDPKAGRELRVARAPVGQISNGASWTFWNGSNWGTNQSSAVNLIPPAQNLSMGISVTAVTNRSYKFIMVSKELEFLGNKALAWTADNPQGPWTVQTPLYVIPDPNLEYGTKQATTYLALIHPEIPMASGKILLSYSMNSLAPNFGEVNKYGNLYNLRFVEVDLPGGSANPGPNRVEPTLVCLGGVPCDSPNPTQSGGTTANPSPSTAQSSGSGSFLALLLQLFQQIFTLIMGAFKK